MRISVTIFACENNQQKPGALQPPSDCNLITVMRYNVRLNTVSQLTRIPIHTRPTIFQIVQMKGSRYRSVWIVETANFSSTRSTHLAEDFVCK